jgi:hypothetical protein
MADLDRVVRDAVEAAGARAVAPPFERVRRRHARARAARLTAAACAGVAAVATAAVAVPALTRDGRAPAAAGVTATPSESEQFPPEGSGWYVCAEPPAGTPRATVGGGTIPGKLRWRVTAWEGRDGARCVSWRTDPRVGSPLHTDLDDDTGKPGALTPRFAWDTVTTVGGDVYVVVWGALDPKVATVRIVANTGTFDVPTVLAETRDRVYVGYVFRNKGTDLGWRYTLLDAAGHELPRPAR